MLDVSGVSFLVIVAMLFFTFSEAPVVPRRWQHYEPHYDGELMGLIPPHMRLVIDVRPVEEAPLLATVHDITQHNTEIEARRRFKPQFENKN